MNVYRGTRDTLRVLRARASSTHVYWVLEPAERAGRGLLGPEWNRARGLVGHTQCERSASMVVTSRDRRTEGDHQGFLSAIRRRRHESGCLGAADSRWGRRNISTNRTSSSPSSPDGTDSGTTWTTIGKDQMLPYDLPLIETPTPGEGSESDSKVYSTREMKEKFVRTKQGLFLRDKAIDDEYLHKYTRSMRRKGFQLADYATNPRRGRWKVDHPKVAVARQMQIQYSPKKMNYVCMLIRRRPVDFALAQLSVLNKKGSPWVRKALIRAKATALFTKKLKRDRLIVSECWVTKGQYGKKLVYHGKGRAGRAYEYYCHVTVVVRELDEYEWNKLFVPPKPFGQMRPSSEPRAKLTRPLPKVWLVQSQLEATVREGFQEFFGDNKYLQLYNSHRHPNAPTFNSKRLRKKGPKPAKSTKVRIGPPKPVKFVKVRREKRQKSEAWERWVKMREKVKAKM
ncbi:50S ribosomal protein L22 [Porphyridium purpureum]|uniref:Large ribosomal subunit protein uL22c n=1 Tax=Porphyridium purpureum TaxID=35688 RepID=A0A5J4YZY4_PORPP|nr:50S ribosomal protein L22 [Porphyridium purpureum]|eukprot:POR3038..scf208_2